MAKAVFWDWSATLADEADFDRNVCESMEKEYARKNKITLVEASKAFKDILKKTENTWKWHDYINHAKEMGVDWKMAHIANIDLLEVLPNVEKVLKYSRRKGYYNCLTTNAVEEVIKFRMGRLVNQFDLIVGSDTVKALKSKGKHLKYVIEKLDIEPSMSFSVGDELSQDITPAKKLGFKTVLCDYNKEMAYYHTEHFSKKIVNTKPDYVINNLIEIKKII
ncbi:MAG: HAD family hydrolase [Candidatus Aenigmatarchaeota archaeon]